MSEDDSHRSSPDDTDSRPEWQQRLGVDLDPVVFFTTAGIVVAAVVASVLFSADLGNFFGALQSGIANYTGWFFVSTMNIVLLFTIYLLFSPFASIRVGGQDAKPEFSTGGWFAMLFSAGMGIGLLFYGVAEPLFHYLEPPRAEPLTVAAAEQAMQFTFLHWGLHPWAVYALVGLALAFFSFNRGMPLTIRSVFYPLLGERIYGWPGNLIDILAAIATLFGLATSLGLGARQINAGLDHLLGIGVSPLIQLVLIVIITAIATISVVRGLEGGIQRLSQFNIVVAFVLLVSVLVLGPTLFILNGFTENVGLYIQNLPSLATWDETYTATHWQAGWTTFYWGWWIAWASFVGMFIARISKGRTIREFVLGVLLVPTLVTFVWMTVFGNSALYIERFGAGGLGAAVQQDVAVSLFVFLENFPFSALLTVLGVIVVITFFVTSSDSGSLVIDTITAGGEPDPPVKQRIFWAVLGGVVAAVLLLSGGLVALQAAAISTALPFAIVILLMCYSVYRGLSRYIAVVPQATERPREPGGVRPPRRKKQQLPPQD